MENSELLLKLKLETDRAIKVHADLAYSLGVYFGYPYCCRLEFFQDLHLGKDPGVRDIDGSGFIPCTKHYHQIQNKKLELKDLIKNRVCPTPFGI